MNSGHVLAVLVGMRRRLQFDAGRLVATAISSAVIRPIRVSVLWRSGLVRVGVVLESWVVLLGREIAATAGWDEAGPVVWALTGATSSAG